MLPKPAGNWGLGATRDPPWRKVMRRGQNNGKKHMPATVMSRCVNGLHIHNPFYPHPPLFAQLVDVLLLNLTDACARNCRMILQYDAAHA